MQVEITKMVYQHPWYVSSAPLPSNGRLGVVFISPIEKVAIGDKIPLFYYCPVAEVVLSGRVRSSRPLNNEQLNGRYQRPVTCHRTRPVTVSTF